MKALITGAHGLLGQKTAIILAQETDATILITDTQRETFFANPRFEYQQLDITHRGDVKSLVADFAPDVIINTAAFTDVDACEDERELAWRVNCDGVKNLIVAMRRLPACHLVHVSTDYVFDGTAAPYGEDAPPNPVSYYGRSKLAAENAILTSGVDAVIARTQVLYGTGYEVRKNFALWVIEMLRKGQPFHVVTDQVGNPTLVDDCAFALVLMAEKRAMGLYHVAGSDIMSRHEFACLAADAFEINRALVLPTTSDTLMQIAHRPANSGFLTLKFESEFGVRLAGAANGLRTLEQQLRHGAQHLDLLAGALPAEE